MKVSILSKEIIDLFYGLDEREKETDPKFYYGYDLSGNKHPSKRKNFSDHFKINYKKYFYVIEKKTNEQVTTEAKKQFKELLGLEEGKEEMVSRNDWNKIAPKFFNLIGSHNPDENK